VTAAHQQKLFLPPLGMGVARLQELVVTGKQGVREIAHGDGKSGLSRDGGSDACENWARKGKAPKGVKRESRDDIRGDGIHRLAYRKRVKKRACEPKAVRKGKSSTGQEGERRKRTRIGKRGK